MEGLATYCLHNGSRYADWLSGSVGCAIILAISTEPGIA